MREVERWPAWLTVETVAETVTYDEAGQEGRDQTVQRP